MTDAESRARLTVLRERLRRISPAPWSASSERYIRSATNQTVCQMSDVGSTVWQEHPEQERANNELIGNAPSDLKWLCDQLEAALAGGSFSDGRSVEVAPSLIAWCKTCECSQLVRVHQVAGPLDETNVVCLVCGNKLLSLKGQLHICRALEPTRATPEARLEPPCVGCGHVLHREGRCVGTTDGICCECICDLDDRNPTPSEPAQPTVGPSVVHGPIHAGSCRMTRAMMGLTVDGPCDCGASEPTPEPASGVSKPINLKWLDQLAADNKNMYELFGSFHPDVGSLCRRILELIAALKLTRIERGIAQSQLEEMRATAPPAANVGELLRCVDAVIAYWDGPLIPDYSPAPIYNALRDARAALGASERRSV